MKKIERTEKGLYKVVVGWVGLNWIFEVNFFIWWENQGEVRCVVKIDKRKSRVFFGIIFLVTFSTESSHFGRMM